MKINKDNLGPHAEFGERFLKALKYADLDHMSYRELGKLLDVSAPVIGRVLHGKQSVANSTAMRISAVTGVDHNWLSTGEGQMIRTVGTMTIDLSGLTEAQFGQISTLVKAMKRDNKNEA